jgi:hypothetical protein
MSIFINKEAAYHLFDALLKLWREKSFPFNLPRAVIPQTIIPQNMRNDKSSLANFYFYTCIYMRGGIESLQAFKALLRLYEDDPLLFDPLHAGWRSTEHVEEMLRKYIGWDAKQAARTWVKNSRNIRDHWGGSALNLFKGLDSYDEALRRLRNKRTKRDRIRAGKDGHGFYGFQPKMVSMLVYFWDWEGLFKKRFIYPSPADFHNFRLGIAHGAICFEKRPDSIRPSEALSAPWREAVMRYLREKKEDPVDLADALWLFSLTLCGESPVNVWQSKQKKRNRERSDKEESAELPYIMLGHASVEVNQSQGKRQRYLRTCGSCPLKRNCYWSIPAGPYYGRGDGVKGKKLSGHLVMLPHPRVYVELSLTQRQQETSQDGEQPMLL